MHAKEGKLVGALAIAASALGFSIYPILGKFVFAGGANLSTILFIRFALAALFFWLIILWQEGMPKLSLKVWLILLGMGAIGYASMAGLYLTAVRYIPASLTALLLYVYPILVMILAVISRQEKISILKVFGLGLASVGLIFVLKVGLNGVNVVGVMLALGAALVYSIYIVIGNRVLQSATPLVSTAIISVGAAATYGIIGLVQGFTWDLSSSTWLGIVGISAFATILAMLAFFWGMQRVGPTTASILSTLEPVMTVVFAYIFLEERFSFWQGVGGALVVMGGLFAVWHPQRKQA